MATSGEFVSRIKRGWAGARALWRDFTGEAAYDKYLRRHALTHPDHPPLSEREFWRERTRFDEENVSTGCC